MQLMKNNCVFYSQAARATSAATLGRAWPSPVGDLADKTHRRSFGGLPNHRRLFRRQGYAGESVQNPRNYVSSFTCATYGNPVRIPMAEDHTQSPVNPHGKSKLFVAKGPRWYLSAHQLKWMSLRYFKTAGADPEGIFGAGYNTPDGNRDHVQFNALARDLLADPSLARQTLGWAALLSNPDAMVNIAGQRLLSLRAQRTAL